MACSNREGGVVDCYLTHPYFHFPMATLVDVEEVFSDFVEKYLKLTMLVFSETDFLADTTLIKAP